MISWHRKRQHESPSIKVAGITVQQVATMKKADVTW